MSKFLEVNNTVSEADYSNEGYSTTVNDKKGNSVSGTIIDSTVSKADFINDKPTPTPTPSSPSDTPTPTPDYHDATASLIVRKNVTGTGAETDRYFNFNIVVSGNLNGKYGDMNFINGHAAVALKSGQEATAYDLPDGTTYSVSEAEANADGYTTYAYGTEGTLTGGHSSAAVFVNEKEKPGIIPDTSDNFNLFRTAGTTITSLIVALLAAMELKK